MAQSDDFFRAFKEQMLLSLNTAFPAIVLSYSNGEATIQPQFMVKYRGQEPVKQPILENVPVIKYRTRSGEDELVLQSGDVVYCVCSQRSLDDVMTGQVYYAGKSRILSMQDAVIVGVIRFANS